jgi:hypothetical protein
LFVIVHQLAIANICVSLSPAGYILTKIAISMTPNNNKLEKHSNTNTNTCSVSISHSHHTLLKQNANTTTTYLLKPQTHTHSTSHSHFKMNNLCSILWLLCLVSTSLTFTFVYATGNVTYDGRSLIINGQRKLLISASIHYPRSVPAVS